MDDDELMKWLNSPMPPNHAMSPQQPHLMTPPSNVAPGFYGRQPILHMNPSMIRTSPPQMTPGSYGKQPVLNVNPSMIRTPSPQMTPGFYGGQPILNVNPSMIRTPPPGVTSGSHGTPPAPGTPNEWVRLFQENHGSFQHGSFLNATMQSTPNSIQSAPSPGNFPYGDLHQVAPSSALALQNVNKRRKLDDQELPEPPRPSPLDRSLYNIPSVKSQPMGRFNIPQAYHQHILNNYQSMSKGHDYMQRAQLGQTPVMTTNATRATTYSGSPQTTVSTTANERPVETVTRKSSSKSSKPMSPSVGSKVALDVAATRIGSTTPPADDPDYSRLCFDPDFQVFYAGPLYFLTVGDKKKALGRGFSTPLEVYSERMRRANIETTDINFAWCPGPDYKDGLLPWQPICGTAAYIGSLRGDLKLRFSTGEDVHVRGAEYKAEHEMDIPLLHDAVRVLWYKQNYCATAYAYRRTSDHSNSDDYTSFMPSQSEWSPENLPPSAAIMEPFRLSKSKVPALVDKQGKLVLDRHGQPRRAFDHVLPYRISVLVEGWLIAAWVAEDPRLQWRDIEAHISPDQDTPRLNDRYSKYRESIPAMNRSTIRAHRKMTTKGDLKTVKQQSHDRLAANSWWFVDAEKDLMSQIKDPMTALFERKPAYPLPMRRSEKCELSERVRDAQDALAKKEAGSSDEAELSGLLGENDSTPD